MSGLSRIPSGGQDTICRVLLLSPVLCDFCTCLFLPFRAWRWLVSPPHPTSVSCQDLLTVLCLWPGCSCTLLLISRYLQNMFRHSRSFTMHTIRNSAITFLYISCTGFLCTEHFQWWSDLKMYQGAASLSRGINQTILANFRHFNLRRDTFPGAEIKGKLINFLHVIK